ncbi:MAG TPA: ABC transporter permease [Acidimicrobiales bacterium]|nr:ABC transporter permease [Acidimicrobiales bacterium]
MGTVSEANALAVAGPSSRQQPFVPRGGRTDDGRELPARVVSSRVTLRTRVREIWHARELFVFLVRKDLKVKYKNSFLGFLWSMLNPAFVLLVYYVVFKYFLKNPTPYFALYLFSGLLIWNLFQTATTGSASVIVANSGIVKKVAFPREILALSQVGTATVFFFFQALVLVAFLVGFQYSPAWSYLPIALFALVDLIIFAAALSVFLSAVNVYFRDIEHLILVLLNAWFWGVPIIYGYNLVYGMFARHHLLWLARIYLVNPITTVVLSFQRALYGKVYVKIGKNPHTAVLATYPYHFYLELLGGLLGASVLLLIGAMLVFGRISGNFAEEL